MATEYAYYLDGRRIAILKKFDTTPDGLSTLEFWGTPDAAEIQGIMFQYTVRINAPSDETTEINVNDYLALGIVEYVKYRLAEDVGDFKRSQYHYKRFKIKANESEDNRRGSPVIFAPSQLSSLR